MIGLRAPRLPASVRSDARSPSAASWRPTTAGRIPAEREVAGPLVWHPAIRGAERTQHMSAHSSVIAASLAALMVRDCVRRTPVIRPCITSISRRPWEFARSESRVPARSLSCSIGGLHREWTGEILRPSGSPHRRDRTPLSGRASVRVSESVQLATAAARSASRWHARYHRWFLEDRCGARLADVGGSLTAGYANRSPTNCRVASGSESPSPERLSADRRCWLRRVTSALDVLVQASIVELPVSYGAIWPGDAVRHTTCRWSHRSRIRSQCSPTERSWNRVSQNECSGSPRRSTPSG